MPWSEWKSMGNFKRVQIGTFSSSGASINVASLFPDKYKDFTTNNFGLVITSITNEVNVTSSGIASCNGSSSSGFSISYNSSNGVLSVSGGYCRAQATTTNKVYASAVVSGIVYLYYNE